MLQTICIIIINLSYIKRNGIKSNFFDWLLICMTIDRCHLGGKEMTDQQNDVSFCDVYRK